MSTINWQQEQTVIFKKEKRYMKSFEARSKQTFLRNEFDAFGKWNIPVIRKNELDLEKVDLISYTDIKTNDTDENKKRGVHFYIDDYRMEWLYYNPTKSIHRLSQYKFLISPDYSLYQDMPKAVQLFNVFRSRWCGEYWQKSGLKVIPNVGWGDTSTFEFCFDGIEKGSIVAVGTIGCKRSKLAFMRGYNEMLKRIEPSAVICFGKPFAEMQGNIISVDYNSSRRVNRNGR